MPGFSTGHGQWAHDHLPYHFQKLEHPVHKWLYLPFNRAYKPLGISSSVDWVKYEDYAHVAMVFHRDPALLTDVWRTP
jgi:hypothetical protein